MSTILEYGLSLIWAIFAGLSTWQCAEVLRQVTYVTLADGRRQERRIPFVFRLLFPLAPNLVPVFRRPSFEKTNVMVTRKLVAAGFGGMLTSEEFLTMKLLLPGILGVLLSAMLLALIALVPGRVGYALQSHGIAFIMMILLGFYAYPALWLRAVLADRQRRIQKSLPFVMDLLTLSVEAGLDFMSAMQRIVSKGKVDALEEELLRVLREIQLGKTRRNALRDLSERVDQSDLRSVLNSLIQADELGVGIASILRIQSDQIRQRRFERAEKMANEAPVKMLFPLVAFIFPAVFLVLLGPIVLQIFRQM
ncbi:MAG: type II secretion system F family protein [bacterium]|jgi:tight adherence protein C